MMDIVFKQAAHPGHDAITITGQIDFGTGVGGAKLTVWGKGRRKSEVVESLIKQIELMAKFMDTSKETIGKI